MRRGREGGETWASMATLWVGSTEELAHAVETLRPAPRWALDTEAAGFHRYRDRLCLVQLGAGGRAVLVDALAALDWSVLASPLADPQREKILHGADYDLRLLRRDAGLRLRGLFDTQVAALLLGERELGLQALVEKYLGRSLTKQFQRADWAQRPLPPAMLAYAVEDVAVLEPLRDRLAEALQRRGRWAWAEEEFRAREEVEPSPDSADPDAFLRLKGAGALSPAALAVLRSLYAWREGVAAARDQAPFRVLANDVLLRLSVQAPQDLAGLRSAGVPAAVVQRHGEELLAAIAEGRRTPPSAWPRRPRPERPPHDPAFAARLERLLAVRQELAQELALDLAALLPRSVLIELARRAPRERAELGQVPGLRRWQIDTFGDRLLEAVT